MKDIASCISDFRRPFPAKFVDWKIQSTNRDENAALVVAFVDARDVAERLNSVCPGQWSNRHAPLIIDNQLQGVSCTINLRDDSGSVSVEDVGIGEPLEDGMKSFERDIRIKTYWSDAFKRAGVKLGIASCLYELPTIWVNDTDQLYLSNGKIRGLSDKGKTALKERYNKWVVSDPIKERFGTIYEA